MEAEREEAPPEEAEGAARVGPLAALRGCFPLGKAKKPQYGQVQAAGESDILDAEPGKRPVSFAEKLLVMAGQKRVLGRGGKDDEPLLFALTWAQPQRFGTPPSPRNGHSMTLIGMHLYVFGGGDENLSFNDVHTLHVGNMAWDKPLLHGTMPSPRSRHSATALGNNMVVFGGVGGGNDLHILEARRRARAPTHSHPQRHPRHTHAAPTPHPRRTHAAPMPHPYRTHAVSTCHLLTRTSDGYADMVRAQGRRRAPATALRAHVQPGRVQGKCKCKCKCTLYLVTMPHLPCHVVTSKFDRSRTL